LIDTGIEVAAIGERFMNGIPYPKVKEHDTILIGESVRVRDNRFY